MVPPFEKFLYPFLLFLRDGELSVNELRAKLARKSARFQSFPDSFVFMINTNRQLRLCGSAVSHLISKNRM